MNIKSVESGISIIERSRRSKLRQQNIPVTPELSKTRINIFDLSKKNPDLPNIDGIELIQHVSERPMGEDYGIFLSNTKRLHLSDILFLGQNIPFLEPHAIACYFDNKGNFIHVGIVTEDSLILSKWGVTGNVYKHKPELVPKDYGSTIIYFRHP